MINPSQFKVISKSVKKTDKNDARVIAEFFKQGYGAWSENERQKDSSDKQSCEYERQVDKASYGVNKIHNILSSHGILLKKESLSSDKGLNRIQEQPVDPTTHVELEVIVGQIKSLNEGIKKLDKELLGHENITSIKGIGKKAVWSFSVSSVISTTLKAKRNWLPISVLLPG